jgi:hypothetical protein
MPEPTINLYQIIGELTIQNRLLQVQLDALTTAHAALEERAKTLQEQIDEQIMNAKPALPSS